ncbi:WhiB family transcriptional regulator [Streptosporangium jomthongense]|uniref:WhiB family transcriptional regulator n=1 Tax=Streptosporangium jomthongense TaxID=1193683 RepID=A0ABV8F2D8_9ACTN
MPSIISFLITPTPTLSRRVLGAGVCVSSDDPDAWFPPEPSPSGGEPVEAVKARRAEYEAIARRLCGGCPVRAECLELALREEHDLPRTWFHGIRGGTAPWERQNMVHNRRRIARRAVQRLAEDSEAVA